MGNQLKRGLPLVVTVFLLLCLLPIYNSDAKIALRKPPVHTAPYLAPRSETLFLSLDALPIVTITTPMEVDEEGLITYPPRESSEWMEDCSITFGRGTNEETFPIHFRLRGHNRRHFCKVPPGKIKYIGDRPQFMDGARNTMNIVYECADIDNSRESTDEQRDQMVIAEHLIYEIMQTLGVPAQKTYLGQFTLIGAEEEILQGIGFFLEHPGDLAEREGAIYRETDGADYASTITVAMQRLKSDDAVTMYLIERLIDDHDNHRIPHNTILLEYPDGSFGLAPYDFDKSNIVFCPTYPSFCDGVNSYDEKYREAKVWFYERILCYADESYDGTCGSSLFEYIDPDEILRAFHRVAEKFLARRQEVLQIANHPYLTPERQEIARTLSNAFFDALEDSSSKRSGWSLKGIHKRIDKLFHELPSLFKSPTGKKMPKN